MRFHLLLLSYLVFLPCLAYAQDFASFLQQFPKGETRLWDTALMEKYDKKIGSLKPISPALAQKFIIDKLYNADGTPQKKVRENSDMLFPYFFMSEAGDVVKNLKNNKVHYYCIEKIGLVPDYQSVIVYYINKTQAKQGIIEKTFVLLNFTSTGELVTAFELNSYLTFTDCRIKTTEISKDLVWKKTEMSYPYEVGGKVSKETAYVYHYYYQVGKDSRLTDIQSQYYPYSGLFVSEDDRECEIEQNNNSFYITEGEKDESIKVGLSTESFDIEKGTFTARSIMQEVWTGAFSVDKNTLTITKENGEKMVYKRVK